jgi:RNA polymerase-binding transcription factor DksA
MADDADIASDYNEIMLSRALGRIVRQDAAVITGPKLCGDCEEAIPEARRKLGFKLCVQCAEETERRKSLFANY